jgi:hypothetical protein
MDSNGTPVMQWEMYGPGSRIQFCGHREGPGFGLRVMRDDTTVLAVDAPNVDTLLRCSSQLRGHLQQLGYAVRPLPARSSQLTGGVCWGPAAPLNSGLLDSVR